MRYRSLILCFSLLVLGYGVGCVSRQRLERAEELSKAVQGAIQLFRDVRKPVHVWRRDLGLGKTSKSTQQR